MNKTDLIAKAAEEAGLPKTTTEKVVNALFGQQTGSAGVIVSAVAEGDEVAILGFGTFSGSERQARMGRNPQTGEEIEIPASTLPKFKAGARFKSALK